MNNITPSTTIGLDLGDTKHAICALNAGGDIIDERTITNHRESLRRLSQKYPGARIALEVGTHSPWISRFFSNLGHEVIVANPRKLRAIFTSDRKSDKDDTLRSSKIISGTCQLIQRRVTFFFEFGLPSPPLMAYTFAYKNYESILKTTSCGFYVSNNDELQLCGIWRYLS